jgi:hypothetical protein
MGKFDNPVKMVCRHCGSENVLADAYVQWNVPHQCWEIQNVFGSGHYCEDCDGECKLDEVECDDV